jgi:L-aminopeptidase/D-esterase-like protein
VIRPGPRNLITDVAGILVGNAEDHAARSGTTVVRPEPAAVCAVDVRGGAPGTRETDALAPTGLVEAVHAIVLSGGSAFGLDAAGGAMAWLAAQGKGFRAADARIPIVPAAILFDLHNGGDKAWGEPPPYRALGHAACAAAAADFALGNAGAGLGAAAGRLKGGLGSASFATAGWTVGALAAVNSLGSVTMGDSPVFWAWPFEQAGELGGIPPSRAPRPVPLAPELKTTLGANTTLVVVATDATLSKTQAARLAVMAQDGIARAIRPAHTPLDGDTVFALATGRRPLAEPLHDLARLGALAADCVARAIARGVYEAADLGALRSWRSVNGAPAA